MCCFALRRSGAALLSVVLLALVPVAATGPATGAEARAAAITLVGPTEASSGDRVVLRGNVATNAPGKPGRPRVVQVAVRAGDRWRVVAKTRSTLRGAYRISVPAGSTGGRRVLRAQAPETPALRAVHSEPLSVTVADGSGDWSFLMNGGSRWNPCAPITWSYNPAGQAYQALSDVTTAFATIAAASGLTFTYVGPTPLVYPGGADITVGWASAAKLAGLADSVVGIGGAGGNKITGHDVAWQLTRGWVTLDNRDPLAPGPGFGASSFGQVLIHELLHALGLGHAARPRNLMYPVASGQNTTFGPGDRAGIAHIGTAAGCL
jgi:hypothetical protein